MTDVFVALAHHSHQPGLRPFLAVGVTAELAAAALLSLIDDADHPELWIPEKPELHTVAEAPPTEPAWRQISEEDQNLLAIAQIEEVNDCAKEIAHEMLDAMTSEEVEEMLQELKEDQEGVI